MTEFSIWLSFMYKCIHAIKDVSLTILRVTFPLFHAGLHAKHIIGEQSVLERSAPKSVQGMLPFEQRSQVSGSQLVQFHFFPSHHFPSLAPLSCQPRPTDCALYEQVQQPLVEVNKQAGMCHVSNTRVDYIP